MNRKALDQYISFTEQRDSLVARKEELDRDYQSIQQLIETLDAQKEDAILRTFTGVSKHFSEVFEELVPGGAGELVMKTTNDEDVEDQVETIRTQETSTTSRKTSKKGSIASTQSQSSLPAQSMSKFVGVQVRVSFAGTGQQFEMQQLSGGQKALVALAIIFSIQRCDPAPFYLFDEIDQALDANYRAGVARLIRNQAESADAPAQFITTTFRPELVAVATKCYGIALQNKVSNIYPLDKVCHVKPCQAIVVMIKFPVVGSPRVRREYHAGRGVRTGHGGSQLSEISVICTYTISCTVCERSAVIVRVP